MTSGPYITEGARRAAHRLGYSLIVLFIVSIGLAAGNLLWSNSIVHSNVQRVQACQLRVVNRFDAAITARARASAKSNQALITLIQQVGSLKGSQAERAAQFQADVSAYIAAVYRVQALKLPQLPAQACG